MMKATSGLTFEGVKLSVGKNDDRAVKTAGQTLLSRLRDSLNDRFQDVGEEVLRATMLASFKNWEDEFFCHTLAHLMYLFLFIRGRAASAARTLLYSSVFFFLSFFLLLLLLLLPRKSYFPWIKSGKKTSQKCLTPCQIYSTPRTCAPHSWGGHYKRSNLKTLKIPTRATVQF